MPDFSGQPYEQQMQAKEVYLRGLYMSIACDIEHMLMDIIAKCKIEDPSKREGYKLKYLSNNSMDTKFKIVKKSVENYNPQYYKKYEGCFKIIGALIDRRNMFGHSKIEEDTEKEDKTVLKFNYIHKGKRIIEIKEIDPLFTELLTYRDALSLLNYLVTVLQHERGIE